ncbi:MAG: hypothetical protein HFE63_09995 [Clostridiales bacterium]|nr:hypothetical protein [Clostridiales bacterium]
MYKNVSGKIKVVAKVFAVIGIIISIIWGLIIFKSGLSTNSSYSSEFDGTKIAIHGLLVGAVGSLLSWLASLTLYGFGELIEQTCKISANLSDAQNQRLDQIYGKNAAKKTAEIGKELLNQLYDDGMITENEYKQKIEEIAK